MSDQNHRPAAQQHEDQEVADRGAADQHDGAGNQVGLDRREQEGDNRLDAGVQG